MGDVRQDQMQWKEYILEDIIERFIDYRGKTPNKVDQGIPLVTAKIVKNGKILKPNEFIAPEDYDSWMTRGLPEVDDIVLTTEAPLGEIALIKDKNVALAQRIITLRGNKDIVYNPFLKYYFQSPTGQYELDSRASGTTVFGIKAAVLRKVPVFLPPLPEQKAIASVLSSLDDKIDLLHRQNKTLEAMAEALFRQWFVERRPELVEEEAEEGWEEGVLSDYADNIKDNVKVNELGKYDNYVGLEHIPKKNIALSSWDNTESIQSNKSRFIENDILFGKLRSYFHKVVYAPIGGVCSTDILVIRPKRPEWFCFCLFWFFSEDVVEHSDLGSEGTRMPRTNWSIVSSFKIPKPTIHEIKAFNQIVLPMLDKITANVKQIQKTEKLRDIILPKLMSGEVRVKV